MITLKRIFWPKFEHRRFYKHVCKTGWYSPMIRCHWDSMGPPTAIYIDGRYYYRPQVGNYRRGYPIWGYNSEIEKHWIDHCKEQCYKARSVWFKRMELKDKREMRVKQLRTQYYQFWRKIFRESGLHQDDIPTKILKLCKDFCEAKKAIRQKGKGVNTNKNGTRTKTTLVRSA